MTPISNMAFAVTYVRTQSPVALLGTPLHLHIPKFAQSASSRGNSALQKIMQFKRFSQCSHLEHGKENMISVTSSSILERADRL